MFKFQWHFGVQIEQISIFLCKEGLKKVSKKDEGLTYSSWMKAFKRRIQKEEEVKGQVMSFPFFIVKMGKTLQGQLPRFFWLPSV